MNIKAALILGLVFLAGVGVLLFRNSEQQNNFEDQIQTVQSSSESPLEGRVEIDISNFDFFPQVIKVKKGTNVVWTNRDPTKHTVTSDEGSKLDSELLAKDQTYESTFSEPGVYRYHCTPHPSMLGAVVVVD